MLGSLLGILFVLSTIALYVLLINISILISTHFGLVIGISAGIFLCGGVTMVIIAACLDVMGK